MTDDATAGGKAAPGKPTRLGRGLAALIGDAAPDAGAQASEGKGSRLVPIEFVRSSANNPRKTFAEDDLVELADSIREKGIIQPLVVRPIENTPGAYEIVAGERRWRAAQRVGLHEVPVVVVQATAQEALELAIIENVQRADLNPLEEAAGYDQLIEQFGYTQADLAKVVGKSRAHVTNTLRLHKLSPYTKSLLTAGSLTAGHARALLSSHDPDSLAKRVVDQGLSVRDVERLVQQEGQASLADASTAASTRPQKEKDADTRDVEALLGRLLGLTVTIDHKPGGGGVLAIRYKTVEQLEAVCERLRS